MLETRISAGTIKQLPGWEKSHANTVTWSHGMEGHAKKFVDRYCDLASKKIEQLFKVSTRVWMMTKSEMKN